MKRKRMNLFSVSLFFLLLLFSSCTDDKLTDGKEKGDGNGTITVNIQVPPILQTRAEVRPATVGSEAEKAGFLYEMVVDGSNDMESDTTTMQQPATKAPAALANVVAILFNADGTFKEKISLNTVTAGTPCTLTFRASGTSYQLVVVANDPLGVINLGQLSSFSGTYADFKALAFTGSVTKDADIPYIGYTTVNMNENISVNLPMYRMMAKVTVVNNTFSITNGPARTGISLINAGKVYFGTNNNYDGTGIISTAVASLQNTTAVNTNTATWFVGENVQSAYTATTIPDRNRDKAPNAAYIQITSASKDMTNKNPKVGEEYIPSGGISFTYDVFLGNGKVSDFSLRRHSNYTITISVNGTVANQQALAITDKRVRVTDQMVHGGLCIGLLGGASGYTTGTGDNGSIISGSYTKYLLLQPNTSGSMAEDNVKVKWSDNTTDLLQSEARKYWDHTYTLENIDKTAGLAYDYCYNLTIGGVAKGTWYLPTITQLIAIYALNLKSNSFFPYYNAFIANFTWCSTENDANIAWCMNIKNGYASGNYYSKIAYCQVRCVRDLV